VTDYFRKGDKVRIKKLSKEEFKKVYGADYNSLLKYKEYLNSYSEYFDNIYLVEKFSESNNNIIILNNNLYVYPEELIKVFSLKDRLNLIKELLK
jgi:hypothetical protein